MWMSSCIRIDQGEHGFSASHKGEASDCAIDGIQENKTDMTNMCGERVIAKDSCLIRDAFAEIEKPSDKTSFGSERKSQKELTVNRLPNVLTAD
jgi:hypothetical protein